MKKTLLMLPMALIAMGAAAKVVPDPMFTDNMVLQHDSSVPLTGSATPNSTVTVTPSWSGKAYTAKADGSGRWSIDIDTPAPGFDPHTITLGDGQDTTLSNVLIGEVWLASGQSNMEMPLRGFDGCCVEDGFNEAAAAWKYADRIRFFTVPLTQSYTPRETVDAVWTVPSADTAPAYSAVAWFFAKRLTDVLDVPVGIVSAAHGGARVESWLPREILQRYPDVSLDEADIMAMTHYLRPMMMYNAMFYPVRDYVYNGIIWYQGCSNVGADEVYADRLADMVEHWRGQIGQGDIPFYSVEIAPFDYDSEEQDNKAALLRKAQWDAVARIPNSGIISIGDLVYPHERHNIHPAQKAEVGNRLGNLALNRTYGKTQFPVVHPTCSGYKFEGNEAWVKIDAPGGGICRNYDIRGFELAGPDRVFYPADSVWLHWQTNEVVASSKKVPEPVAVRYCWNDFELGTLHGPNFLPLVPFRSDDW